MIEVTDLSHYQRLALVTEKPEQNQELRALHAIMGVAGEVGECLQLIANPPPLGDEYIGELGDLLWYSAVLMDVLGVDLGEVDLPEAMISCDLRSAGILSAMAMVEHMKKVVFYGRKMDKSLLRSQVEIILACICHECNSIKAPLKLIAETNIDKLAKRHPDGFSAEFDKQKCQ